MSRSRLAPVTLLLIALGIAQLLNLLLVGNRTSRIAISDILQFLSALAAAVLLTVLAVRLRHEHSPRALGWSFIAAASWSFAAGALVFMFLEVVFEQHPYPGLSDIFYFGFYPLAVYGLARLPREPLSPREKVDSAIEILVLAAVSAMVIWELNVGQLLHKLAAEPSLGSRFSLVYSVLDMALLWMVFVALLRQVIYSTIFLSLLTAVVGCFFLVSADLMQANTTLSTFFVSGTIADVGWAWFSVLLGLSAVFQLASAPATTPATPFPSIAGRTVIVLLTTYLWLGLMLSLLVWHVVARPGASATLLIAGILIVFMMALYRQVRSIEENERLCDLIAQANAELETRVHARTAELEAASQQLRKSEVALRASEQRYRGLIEATGTGWATVDLQGQVIDANSEFARLAGRSTLDQVVGHSVLEWTAPYDIDRNRQELEKCIREGFVRDLDIDYILPDGRVMPVEIDATVVDAAEGRVILSLCRDITERRKTERELKLTQFSVDHGSEAAFWMDSEARFVYVNRAGCDSLGYTLEEMQSMSVFDIDPFFTRENWADGWRAMKERGSIRLESCHKTKEGRVFPVEIVANFLEYGGKQYDFAFVRDISERRQVEEDKRRFYRETIRSVTQGKLDLATKEEIGEYLDSADLVAKVACPADVASVRHEIVEYCESHGLRADRMELFETAVGEALANAIKHANGGTAYAGVRDSSIWCAVSDTGGGISTLTLPSATLRLGFSTKASLGIGYSIMMEAADQIMLGTDAEGTTVVLSISAVAPERPLVMREDYE